VQERGEWSGQKEKKRDAGLGANTGRLKGSTQLLRSKKRVHLHKGEGGKEKTESWQKKRTPGRCQRRGKKNPHRAVLQSQTSGASERGNQPKKGTKTAKKKETWHSGEHQKKPSEGEKKEYSLSRKMPMSPNSTEENSREKVRREGSSCIWTKKMFGKKKTTRAPTSRKGPRRGPDLKRFVKQRKSLKLSMLKKKGRLKKKEEPPRTETIKNTGPYSLKRQKGC